MGDFQFLALQKYYTLYHERINLILVSIKKV
jgi:hypothetical protein